MLIFFPILLFAVGLCECRPMRHHALVLGLDPFDENIGFASYALEGNGIPHTVVKMRESVLDAPSTAPLGLDASTTGTSPIPYSLIVITSVGLAYESSPNVYKRALTPSHEKEIRDYQSAHGVRAVVLYSYPEVDALGFSVGSDTGSFDSVIGLRWAASGPGSPAALPLSPSLHAAPPDDLFVLPEFIYRFSAAVPTAAESGATHGYPVLFYTSGKGKDQVAAGLFEPSPGAWRLEFFFDHSERSRISAYMATMWIDWASRGTFVGARRVLVNLHLDDTFLATQTWQESMNGRSPNKTYRLTPTDLEEGRQWTQQVHSRLPEGSHVRLLHAFNGAGVVLRGGPDRGSDPLFDASGTIPHMKGYYWCSHTYTHPSLDEMSYETAYWELNRNVEIGVRLVDDDREEYLETYSPASMVTPMITGLFNGDALAAMADNGIFAAVGDNSRDELVPTTSLWHGIHTTVEEHGFKGFFIIPRHAALIYYDCSVPTENEAEYSFVYRERLGGRRVTIGEIYDLEITRYTRMFLFYRHDPVMFHQANLRFFDKELLASPGYDTMASTSDHPRVSLITHWFDVVIVKTFLKLSTLPILTQPLDEVHQIFLEREARDKCAPVAISPTTYKEGVSMDKQGTLSLSISSACEVALTNFVDSDIRGRRVERLNPGTVRFERYGPMRILWVRPLTSPTTVTVVLDGKRAAGTNSQDAWRSERANADAVTSTAAPSRPASAARRRLTGGLNDGAVGVPYEITVVLHDDAGNPVAIGGDTLTVVSTVTSTRSVIGAPTTRAAQAKATVARGSAETRTQRATAGAPTSTVTDHGNGTYTVAVTVEAPGVWSHSVRLRLVNPSNTQSTYDAPLGSGPVQVVHLNPPPVLVSFESAGGIFRSDPDALTLIRGDTLTLTFDRPTNRPPVGTRSQVDDLFHFSQRLGANYTGAWSDDGTKLVITVTDDSPLDEVFTGTELLNPDASPSVTPKPPKVVGALRVTLRGKRPWGKPLPGVLDSTGASVSARGVSEPLGGYLTVKPPLAPGDPGADGKSGTCEACWLAPIIIAIVLLALIFAVMAYQRHKHAKVGTEQAGKGNRGTDWGHPPATEGEREPIAAQEINVSQYAANPGSWHMDLGL